MKKLYLIALLFLIGSKTNLWAQKTAWFDPDKPATTYCNPINIGYNYTTQNHNGIPESRNSYL